MTVARGSITLVLSTLISAALAAPQDRTRETDPAVLLRLERFQDWRFGFMMHWGPYSQWGAVESWTLCSEDEPWCRRPIANYQEYLRRYEELPRTFNPRAFDPARWAEAAWQAGMRYVVFTTKHHDGFCMFDTAQTDYKITAPDCAFHDHPQADVTRAIFDAFRARGFAIGAYFSKPDWHSNDYWAEEWAHADRNVNYDPARHPERWQRFRDFTYRQIEELMTGYGRIDILWLDGGWVRPIDTVTDDVKDWAGGHGYDQDIVMPRIAAMARGHQPGILIVDRTVHGRYENYQTPEQQVPPEPLDGPWETCMTMAEQWSFKPDDRYKSPRELVHLLVRIAASGGNFLLNVGPGPDGELPAPAYARLADLAAWMQVNATAIHATRPLPPYREADLRFTRASDGQNHAILLAGAEENAPPPFVLMRSHQAREGSAVHLLGVDEPLTWQPCGSGMLITIPAAVQQTPPCQHAWTFTWRE